MGTKKSPCEAIKFQIQSAVETIGQVIPLPELQPLALAE